MFGQVLSQFYAMSSLEALQMYCSKDVYQDDIRIEGGQNATVRETTTAYSPLVAHTKNPSKFTWRISQGTKYSPSP